MKPHMNSQSPADPSVHRHQDDIDLEAVAELAEIAEEEEFRGSTGMG